MCNDISVTKARTETKETDSFPVQVPASVFAARVYNNTMTHNDCVYVSLW